jgi:hypothetical protein
MKNQPSHRTESRRPRASRSSRRIGYGLILAVAVGFTGSLSLVTSWTAWADEPESSIPAPVPLTSGEVTANRGEALSIDGKEYPLALGVMVSDDYGGQREVKDFVPGADVKYHLKNGKIDAIVLILPK